MFRVVKNVTLMRLPLRNQKKRRTFETTKPPGTPAASRRDAPGASGPSVTYTYASLRAEQPVFAAAEAVMKKV